MTSKIELLKQLQIGKMVAEEEAEELEKYFVETDIWQKIYKGEIDIVYGPKGSGKSALYTLLSKKEDQLFDDNILVAFAENVRGSTVFKGLTSEPPKSEFSFKYLWKIYFLVVIANTLREYDIPEAKRLVTALEDAKLLPSNATIINIYKSVIRYFWGYIKRDPKAVEWSLSIDEGGSPSLSRKTEFKESDENKNLEEIPVEELLDLADKSLEKAKMKIWILFDRLDVAFADSPDLERNALRSLFRVYNDLKSLSYISLKVFVRDDIWRRITEGGFSEASHITSVTHIKWSTNSLINLIVRRLLCNPALVEYYSLDAEDTLKDYEFQVRLMSRILPEKVDTGKNPATFKWILGRTCDATGQSAPRELIHMFESIREEQIKKVERGESLPEGEALFERSVFKEALKAVSKVRYEQTLIAEYPEMKEHLELLEGEKSEHNLASLARIWGDEENNTVIAKKLVDIGFFEQRGTKQNPSYWVPFIYRSALSLIQGKAEELDPPKKLN